MADKKDGGLLNGLLGAAAVAGAATVISKLEKEAKEEGKDILDVAKEKVGDIIEDAKSGELAADAKGFVENISDKIEDVIEDAKTGDLAKNLQEKAKDVIEDVQTSYLKNILKMKNF